MLLTRPCAQCQRPFAPRGSRNIYCSDKCRRDVGIAKKGGIRTNFYEGVCAGTIGAIAELFVAARLMREGYHVFRALSPHAPCDLIALNSDSTRYLEVRTGRRYADGKLTFAVKHNPLATEFAVYIPETEELLFIPIGDTTDGTESPAA